MPNKNMVKPFPDSDLQIGFDDDGTAHLETPMGNVRINQDGTAEIEGANGVKVVSKGGTYEAEIPNIHAIGIKNLLDVQDLSFSDNGQVVDIKVIFDNGGTLELSYDKSGKLNKLSSRGGVEASIDGELGEITYNMPASKSDS